jgi:histidyl-tRNA synthetase
MLARLWQALGIADGITLALNSIGDAAERRAHRASLIDTSTRHEAMLDADAKRRLHTNPLRILDSKNPALAGRDRRRRRTLVDLLGDASRAHFRRVAAGCSPRRASHSASIRASCAGLDYYNRTGVRVHHRSTGRAGTVAGGGRYDGLFEQLAASPRRLRVRDRRRSAGADAGIVREGSLLSGALRMWCTPAMGRRARVACRGSAARRRSRRIVNCRRRQLQVADERADASGARYALVDRATTKSRPASVAV